MMISLNIYIIRETLSGTNITLLKVYMPWNNTPTISFGSNDMYHLEYKITREEN